MSMEITFELSDKDLDYFWEFMLEAREKVSHRSESEIIEGARSMLSDVWNSESCSFVRERMSKMEISWLIGPNTADRERITLNIGCIEIQQMIQLQLAPSAPGLPAKSI